MLEYADVLRRQVATLAALRYVLCVCCSVSQCVAVNVCCSVLRCVAVTVQTYASYRRYGTCQKEMCVLQCIAVCCSVLQ